MTEIGNERPLLDDEATRIARRVTGRAVLRLEALEIAMLGAIVVLCLLGGALIALLISALFGVPFRWAWSVASLLLFVVPALVAWRRERDDL